MGLLISTLIVIFRSIKAESEVIEALIINLLKIRVPRTFIIFPFSLELLECGIAF